MNRIVITLICIMIIISGIFTASIILKDNSKSNEEIIKTGEISEETILDDCTDEYEEIERNNAIQASSNNEEKISPNCSFTEKIYYKKCGHTISEYLELPTSLVNLTENEIKEKYPDWELEKFSSNEIILSKELDTECGEHYLVKDNNGKLVIYKIKSDGSEVEIERTDISTEYLTDTDKIDIEKGIRINGKQKLNEFIEDFE